VNQSIPYLNVKLETDHHHQVPLRHDARRLCATIGDAAAGPRRFGSCYCATVIVIVIVIVADELASGMLATAERNA
jgi:hypothetical protein